MKTLIRLYTCQRCSSSFPVSVLAGQAYGLHLLRSESGAFLAHADLLTDQTDKEIETLVEALGRTQTLKITQRLLAIDHLFERSCDPAPDGSSFRTGRDPTCPGCGQENVTRFTANEPPDIRDMDIPHVTHHAWQGLSPQVKLDLAKQAIEWAKQERDHP